MYKTSMEFQAFLVFQQLYTSHVLPGNLAENFYNSDAVLKHMVPNCRMFHEKEVME
jgi:hypothetical protein